MAVSPKGYCYKSFII